MKNGKKKMTRAFKESVREDERTHAQINRMEKMVKKIAKRKAK